MQILKLWSRDPKDQEYLMEKSNLNLSSFNLWAPSSQSQWIITYTNEPQQTEDQKI